MAKDLDPEILKAKTAEYVSLRTSIDLRVRQRTQIVAASIAVFGTMVVLSEYDSLTAQIVLIIYPIIAWLFAIRWEHLDTRIVLIGHYIHEHIEAEVGESVLGWYTYFFRPGTPKGARPTIVSVYWLIMAQGAIAYCIACIELAKAHLFAGSSGGFISDNSAVAGVVFGFATALNAVAFWKTKSLLERSVSLHNERYKYPPGSEPFGDEKLLP